MSAVHTVLLDFSIEQGVRWSFEKNVTISRCFSISANLRRRRPRKGSGRYSGCDSGQGRSSFRWTDTEGRTVYRSQCICGRFQGNPRHHSFRGLARANRLEHRVHAQGGGCSAPVLLWGTIDRDCHYIVELAGKGEIDLLILQSSDSHWQGGRVGNCRLVLLIPLFTRL